MTAIRVTLLFLLTFGSADSRADVVDGRFFSEALGVEKAYRVYLPVNYSSIEDDQFPEVMAIYGSDIANWRSHDPYSIVADSSSIEVALYLDYGSEDDFQFDALAAALDELLTNKDIDHEYHSVPGGHNDDFFAARIEHSLRFHMQRFEQAASH